MHVIPNLLTALLYYIDEREIYKGPVSVNLVLYSILPALLLYMENRFLLDLDHPFTHSLFHTFIPQRALQ